MTAVEWLVSNIDWMLVRNCKDHYKMIIEQAKEMEKSQIIDAYDVQWDANVKNGKDYYNKKFNK